MNKLIDPLFNAGTPVTAGYPEVSIVVDPTQAAGHNKVEDTSVCPVCSERMRQYLIPMVEGPTPVFCCIKDRIVFPMADDVQPVVACEGY